MSLFYKLQYLVGMTPWERMPSLPLGDQAAKLLDQVEQGIEPPFGRALDLGCGTGFWSVNLAQRGWDVTGVDIVPKAVRAARARASKASVECRFLEGSVTELTNAGIGSGFRLFLDFGVIHGLSPEQVRVVGRQVTALAADDAAIVMYAFSPGNRGPLPRGIGREEIEQAYEGWKVIEKQESDLTGAPRLVQKAGVRFYCLRRNGS